MQTRRDKLAFRFTLFGSAGLLALGIWPGCVESCLFGVPFGCVLLPVIGTWFLLLIGWAFIDILAAFERPNSRRWWGLAAASVLISSIALLWLNVPQRIVFAFCHTELQTLVQDAPVDTFGGAEIHRRIGPYFVDRYGADSRGGVYFRTAAALFVDEFSYGFAFRPNGVGCSFGKTGYRKQHLFGDWYSFTVSDD